MTATLCGVCPRILDDFDQKTSSPNVLLYHLRFFGEMVAQAQSTSEPHGFGILAVRLMTLPSAKGGRVTGVIVG